MAISPLSFSLPSPFVLNSSPSHLFPRFRSEKLRRPSPSPIFPSRPIISRHSFSVEPEAASDSVVAQDVKYGNKQVISLTPQLYQYVLANVRDPPVLRKLREETAGMRGS
ncbi:hypothetical protein KSP39_PZI013709 [Platanthera zijinensis]|uniref:Uncharacterized protein n=1 Tax=Platanthera zijinensis TaxID=2320716 RepID=A0AAP0BD55_9ASPA